jgi:putative transposase
MSVFTLEDRIKAVVLYLKGGGNLAAVCRELGYPSPSGLKKWVEEFKATATLHNEYRPRAPKYSQEQKQAAVVDLCSGNGSAREVAEKYGVNLATLYVWRVRLLGKEHPVSRKRRKEPKYTDDKDALMAKVESLKKQLATLEKQVYWARLEKDVLEVTAELLKKGQGADPKKLSNREKAAAIGALKKKYPLNDLLACLAMPKSSYFYHHAAQFVPDKYAELRERVRAVFKEAHGRYGYRRVHAVLTKDGGAVSEKVVRRLMREGNLVVVGHKKRKYSSYLGEISPAVPNLIERDFHADAPNTKWLTDLTEFSLPAGKVYLSPVIDCFDGMVVSWSIGTSPDAELANSTLDKAISTLGEDERPVVHSDRGCHYRWPGWLARMEAAGLTRSMSKKGCSPDNAPCEGFFGRVKNELFYGKSWAGVSIPGFIRTLDGYLHWYVEDRIKMSLGGRSPMEYRRALGYA